MKQPSGRSIERSGFTITELVVVLAIIGVMTVVAVPMFNNIARITKGRSAATQVQSHMRLMRQVAVSRQVNVEAEFDDDEGTYQLTYASGTSNGLTVIPKDQPAASSQWITIAETVIMTTIPGGDGFVFSPKGTIAALDGSANMTIVLQCFIGSGRTDQYTITANSVGKVSMERVEL